jgi:hypothetical protein
MNKTCKTLTTIISVIIIFNLFVSSAWSQNWIQGKITGDVQAGIIVNIYKPYCGSGEVIVDTVTTNSEGVYWFGCLANGTYTVVPDNASYLFTPELEQITIPNTDFKQIDFNAVIAPGDECVGIEEQGCGSSDVGQCIQGIKICNNGYWGTCVGAIVPVSEICDGFDNNCDGVNDESCDCDGTLTLNCRNIYAFEIAGCDYNLNSCHDTADDEYWSCFELWGYSDESGLCSQFKIEKYIVCSESESLCIENAMDSRINCYATACE